MGYRHINNLYKDQRILEFRECFALEKIHGTSAHVLWRGGELHFRGGGEPDDRFAAIFDRDKIAEGFRGLSHSPVVVYGEAYGGKQQKQAWRYGPQLKFVAFEVRIGETWLSVPDAHDVATRVGFEFVHYRRIPATLEAIDNQRDAPSEQAIRNGITDSPKPREGVVLRPPFEVRTNNGERIAAKHKRDEERETKSKRRVGEQREVLVAAQAVADEWVTETRLDHVLDKLPPDLGIEDTKEVIIAMTNDVLREGEGEFVDSRPVRNAIGRATAYLFKQRLQRELRND